MASVKQTSKNPNYQLPITNYRPLLQLHSNQTGAISVLVLLTIWCLVAMVAMIWNTSEIADRRQLMQNAADSAAHATATLYARATNAIAAQNMIIAQDGAAEVLWQAIPPTDKTISTELAKELAAAQAMLAGQDPILSKVRNSLLQQLLQVDNEYVQVQASMDAVTTDAASLKYPDKQTAASFKNKLRQANIALSYLSNNYVEGQLRPAVIALTKNSQLTDQMLEAIIQSIIAQQKILAAFEAQTSPATSEDLPTAVSEHEQKVFSTEMQMFTQLPIAVEEQRKQLSTFYKTDITLASLKSQPANELYAAVQNIDGMSANNTNTGDTLIGPIMSADSAIPVEGHVDLIRAKFPDETTKAGLSAEVTIDPINPHTGLDRVWYPDQYAPVPADQTWLFPNPATRFFVSCNVPGGWGHAYAFPIEHYLTNRVGNDSQQIYNTYMVPIDALRQQLAQQLATMSGGNGGQGFPMPQTQLPDSVPDPITGGSQTIAVLTQLPTLGWAPSTFRTEVLEYNKQANIYFNRVKSLARSISNFGSNFSVFTQPLAVPAWSGQLNIARFNVMVALGGDKRFMVLSSYQLHAIPEWAKSGAYDSAHIAVYEKIISENLGPVSRQVLNALVVADPRGYKNPNIVFMRAMYSVQASEIAQEIVTQIAAQASPDIAAEMVSREWPYEMAPPLDVVPPSRGMGKPDRQRYFSIIAGARETDDSKPKLLLPWIFGANDTTITAVAQAESINWMEYNSSYGGSEFFDQISSNGYGEFLLCPRAWRVASIGGWNWQPRLALSDMLSQAIEEAPVIPTNDLLTYMQNAGIKGNDQDAMDVVNVH